MDLKIYLNIISFIIALIFTIILFKKYKLNRQQKLIFIVFSAFWTSTVLIRSYRRPFAESNTIVGGLGLAATLGISIASVYGLISIFARSISYFLADFFKSRKKVILLSLFLTALSGILVYFKASYKTLYFSSLALGISASMLTLFNMIFQETFTKEETAKSVFILSLAPLLAEFLVAPIQYFFTKNTVANYHGMWLTSAVLALIGMIAVLFIKEEKKTNNKMTLDSFKRLIKSPNTWIYGLIGMSVSLIKFSLSGTNLLNYFKTSSINMSPLLISYSDFVFSLFQMIAGFIGALVVFKKFRLKNNLILGLSLSLIFNIILITVTNQYVLFFSQILAGFSYGVTYNSLISLAMANVSEKDKEMSMSIFQTFFALGIFFGDKIYALIIGLFSEKLQYQNTFITISILTIISITIITLFLKEKDKAN